MKALFLSLMIVFISTAASADQWKIVNKKTNKSVGVKSITFDDYYWWNTINPYGNYCIAGDMYAAYTEMSVKSIDGYEVKKVGYGEPGVMVDVTGVFCTKYAPGGMPGDAAPCVKQELITKNYLLKACN